MNQMTTVPPTQPSGGHSGSLIPRTLVEAMRLAEVMSGARAIPGHLQGDPGSCFMIVEQSQRWNMSPFLVAQCTSNIGGKLCYEGKLIAAALTSTGAIIGEFDYEFFGDPKKPETLSVKATALRASDQKRKDITVAWVDVKTNNKFWLSQPEQQLCYASARIWGRRWAPGPMLGVYAPEEIGAEFAGSTIEVESAAVVPPAPEPPPPTIVQPRRTVKDFLADLKLELDATEGQQEIEAICDKHKKIIDALKNGGKTAFDEMLAGALDRVTGLDTETAQGMET